MFREGVITQEEALANADSANNLALAHQQRRVEQWLVPRPRR